MQAAVAGLKGDADGRVVEVVVGRTAVEVVVRGSEMDVVDGFTVVVAVTVGRTMVDVVVAVMRVGGGVVVVVVVGARVVVVVGARVVVVVVPGSGRLAQLVRQAAKALRHCANRVGCAHALEHVAKAAVVAEVQAASPWQRGPATVQAFWHAEAHPVPFEVVGISHTASWFTHRAAQATPVPGAKQLAKADANLASHNKLLAVQLLRAPAAWSRHAWVASLNGGSGGRVVVVVVGRGRVVVVGRGRVVVVGWATVELVVARSVVEVVADMLVVDGTEMEVEVVAGGIVVEVTVDRGVVVVVIVVVVVGTVPSTGHFTRQAVKAVLHAWAPKSAPLVHTSPHVTSAELAQAWRQLASDDVVAASQRTFLEAQLTPHVAPLPSAKQLPIAVL